MCKSHFMSYLTFSGVREILSLEKGKIEIESRPSKANQQRTTSPRFFKHMQAHTLSLLHTHTHTHKHLSVASVLFNKEYPTCNLQAVLCVYGNNKILCLGLGIAGQLENSGLQGNKNLSRKCKFWYSEVKLSQEDKKGYL